MPIEDGISIVIVSYNCLDSLRRCIDSLKIQRGVEQEIIVVDNDSRDGTIEYLKTQGVKSIFPGQNLGYGAAINLGAEKASGKYILILNPDTEFPGSALQDLYRFAESSSDLGVLSPVLIHPDGGPQLSARKLPGRAQFFLGRGSPLFRLGVTGERQAGYIEAEADDPLQVPAVSATAILIERAFFEDLGGFDERFFLYLEDIDLCRRIRDTGRKIILLPTVKVIHHWRKSSSQKRFFASYHHHLSVWRYFRKYYPGQWFYNIILLAALMVGFIMSSIICLPGSGRKD